jgi:hypothetical protein
MTNFLFGFVVGFGAATLGFAFAVGIDIRRSTRFGVARWSGRRPRRRAAKLVR